MAFCSSCGAQMADNVAFCPNCGKAAGQAAPGATAPPPPAPAAGYNTTAAPAAPATPLAENVAGMLAYFTILPAIIFLLIEPYNRNPFVRFHSFQCLFTAVAIVVIEVALGIISTILHLVPVIGWMITAILWPLLGLAFLGLWILLVIKAYQHQIYKLPYVGDMAAKQAGIQ